MAEDGKPFNIPKEGPCTNLTLNSSHLFISHRIHVYLPTFILKITKCRYIPYMDPAGMSFCPKQSNCLYSSDPSFFGGYQLRYFFWVVSDCIQLVQTEGSHILLFATKKYHQVHQSYICANYSDFSRGHPKWWFSKGIPPPTYTGPTRAIRRTVRESPQNYLNSGLGIIIVICQVMYLIPCPQKFNPRFEKSMKLLIFFVALGIDLLQMPVLGLPGDVPGNP